LDAAPEQRLREAFERIHRERMAGLPILHPDLRVAVIGGRRWQHDWIGVLLTPWCMNLVLLPGPGAARRPGSAGSTQRLVLPAGTFELVASHEAGVGAFAACSLFSPMHGFADQAAAVATAEAVMQALFAPPEAPPAADARRSLPAGISRRDLLRGRLRR
jgi:[NiFe] hydrogenase assembly HybE family chaperone